LGCRSATELAEPSRQRGPVLAAGTVLRYLGARPDTSYEGIGVNFWEVDPPLAGGTAHIATALEGRWGGHACLVDALIVPSDAELLTHPARIARLIDDLYEIVERVRTREASCIAGQLERERAAEVERERRRPSAANLRR
jgi:hypothetical protein